MESVVSWTRSRRKRDADLSLLGTYPEAVEAGFQLAWGFSFFP